MSQNIFINGQSWQNFQDLENKVLECLDYVALDEDHEKVWSNRFGELLIRVGSTIDSFFNKARDCDWFDQINGIQELRQKRRPNMVDYRTFFEGFYKLSDGNVSIHQSTGVLYKCYFPFDSFSSNQIPNWWKSHNKVKHEWYDSLNEHGTLKNVVEALGGLFILNILHKDCQDWLVENDVIIESYLGRYSLKNILKYSKIGIPSAVDCLASSRIYKHVFRQTRELG